MSEGGFNIIKYIIFFFCLGIWFIGGASDLKQVTTKTPAVVIPKTANVYVPQVHYQTIILR